MTIFLTITLWIILVGVPTSTKQLGLLGHQTTFPKVSPSVLKVRWYSTCLLEFHYWNRNLPQPKVCHFIPLSWFILIDHRRPIFLIQRTFSFKNHLCDFFYKYKMKIWKNKINHQIFFIFFYSEVFVFFSCFLEETFSSVFLVL